MSRDKSKVAVGVFDTKSAAQGCVDELVDAGFKRENIGVISRDGDADQAGESGTMWEEGATVGVATGAGVGALWALGMAAGMLPAIGPVIAGGLLASVLASAAGGAAVAGLVGALIGLGIPEEDAEYYEGRFKEGKAIVTVRADGRYADAARIIVRNGGHDRAKAESAAALPASEVKHEKTRARKTPVKKGEVRIHKEVVTEQQALEVPVERGEVSVGKRKVPGTRTVTTPVRREKVKVEEQGKPRVVRR